VVAFLAPLLERRRERQTASQPSPASACEDVRCLTVDILNERGYCLLSAHGSSETLLSQHPDLVLGMADLVVPRIGHKRTGRPSLLLCTTDKTPSYIMTILEEGVELIVKPFRLKGLGAQVAKCWPPSERANPPPWAGNFDVSGVSVRSLSAEPCCSPRPPRDPSRMQSALCAKGRPS
jgi:hypothetical protein